MVNVPLDVASILCLSALEYGFAVGWDVRLGPLARVVRLHAVESVRLCAYCSQSTGDGPQPLSRTPVVVGLVC